MQETERSDTDRLICGGELAGRGHPWEERTGGRRPGAHPCGEALRCARGTCSLCCSV